ncbi:MAG TPA: Arm DNA-binding domain-containing protein [Sphingomonadaceae bacterium]|nr:Arm DNA-binding domain-containing protein [Sphingomonadaceae bacterium]
MPLTVLKIRHVPACRHADTHDLYLLVRETGARSWVLRMQHDDRRRDFGLGATHDVSLSNARILAANLRKTVQSGLDPAAGRPCSASWSRSGLPFPIPPSGSFSESARCSITRTSRGWYLTRCRFGQ